jgi:polyphenol oxidase
VDAAGAAVRAMTREFGTDPADVVAAIGPCLGPCCGEVGDEVVEAFRQAGHPAASLERWFTDNGSSGRPHVDLWTATSDQLVAAGVPFDRVHVARLCRDAPDSAAFLSSRQGACGADGRGDQEP